MVGRIETGLGLPVPMIGRDRELERSLVYFAEAVTGDARVVLVEGDAGAGKTMLIEAIVERVRRLGRAMVVSAACDDHQGQQGRPLLALVSALGVTLDLSIPAEGIGRAKNRLSSTIADDVVDLVLGNAAAQPLLLVIDDLHWADEVTGAAVQQLAAVLSHRRRSSGTPVMLLCGVRPGVHSPVARSLVSRLAREPIIRRIPLGPLREEEVARLVSVAAGARPAARLITDLMRITGGNPLLLRSALRCGLELDAIGVRQGTLLSKVEALPAAELSVEADLEQRLGRLKPATFDMLMDVALSGDNRTLDELEIVSGIDPGAMTDALDELLEFGILTERGERYGFTHPQLRQIVMSRESLPVRRRRHLHLAERWHGALTPVNQGDGSDAIAIALSADQAAAPAWLDVAHHLELAGAAARRQDVAAAAEAATSAAWAIGAWAQAARFAELALAQLPDHAAEQRRRLHHRAGIAYYHNADSAKANEHLRRAIEQCRDSGDISLWGDSVLWLARNRTMLESEESPRVLDSATVSDFLTAAGDEVPVLRALLCEMVAEIQFSSGDFDGGLDSGRLGWEALGEHGDLDALTALEFGDGLNHMGRLDLRRAERNFTRSARHSAASVDTWRRSWGPARLAIVALISGRPLQAEALAEEAERHAITASNWGERALAVALRSSAAARQGKWGLADELADEAALLYERSEFVFVPSILYPNTAWSRAIRGDRLGAEAALQQAGAAGTSGLWRFRRACESLAGSAPVRPADLDTYRVPSREPTAFTISAWSATLDVADLDDVNGPLRQAGPVFETFLDRGVASATDWGTSIDRLASIARWRSGDPVAAISSQDRLIEHLATQGSVVEAARARFDFARIAVSFDDGPNQARARSMLSSAAAEFERLGMLPFVRRARTFATEHQHRLWADGRADLPRSNWVLLYSDIVNSTELNVVLGDTRHYDLMREHDRVVNELLERHQGTLFKHHGDGVAAWFASADHAISCALDLRAALNPIGTHWSNRPLQIRTGIVAGDVTMGVGDLHGLTVVRAVRVCSYAQPDQVVVGSEIVDLIDQNKGRLVFHSLGEQYLKHLPTPERLFSIASSGGAADGLVEHPSEANR